MCVDLFFQILFLKIFYFKIIFDLQKSCSDSNESFYMFFISCFDVSILYNYGVMIKSNKLICYKLYYRYCFGFFSFFLVFKMELV